MTAATFARKWSEPTKAEHPAPEVPCRLAQPHEIPRAAGAMRTNAERAEWRVIATYARGTRPGLRPKVVDSLALRMCRNGLRAVAIWVDGKFDFAIRWGAGISLERLGAREFSAWLVAA
jgi:hypothetical protein